MIQTASVGAIGWVAAQRAGAQYLGVSCSQVVATFAVNAPYRAVRREEAGSASGTSIGNRYWNGCNRYLALILDKTLMRFRVVTVAREKFTISYHKRDLVSEKECTKCDVLQKWCKVKKDLGQKLVFRLHIDIHNGQGENIVTRKLTDIQSVYI
ncbi:hypothetical protein EVAR_49023_1 [Eumeta japonica]|uniref:Uncharacterized protein n=1 Tax=Eumeta variegata TaxID=151549 RepID=A0A4C1XQ94_EUMVA|nr:hypothetical protein EVAR_49023_1 [Eumeta japonica]